MDEPNKIPEPAHPSSPETVHPASSRRIKRRLMFALIGLYAVSVVAACVLLMRSPDGKKDGKDGALLSLAEKDSVGWVSIHGPISSSAGGKPWEKGVEQWSRRIQAMADNPSVKAIVLDINSPGGSVGAVQELYSQILRVRKEKNIPIVALFGDVAASGGYYIAAACDQIVAHPGSLTGSIGVIFSVSNLEGLFNKIGYKMDPIKSGVHKDIGSPARPMTKEERAILQALIDDAYGQFVAAVAGGRHMTEADVRPLADGRIYSGRQALDLKLVDKLGDSTDAVELAGKLGGIAGKPKVKRDADSSFKGIFELLDSRLGGALSAGNVSLFGDIRHLTQSSLEYRWAGF